jgi:hypothetical protein
VPRRDCIPRRGRSHDGTGGDHHPARRVAQQQEDLTREGALEAAPRLDRRADDHELGPALGRDACDLLAEAAGPGTDDFPTHVDAVRAGDGRRGLESLLQAHELPVEVRLDRQLTLEDGRRDEHDTRAAVGREPAGEIERMLRLLPVEQRHDDGAIRDRASPAREAPSPPMEPSDVGQPHRISW